MKVEEDDDDDDERRREAREEGKIDVLPGCRELGSWRGERRRKRKSEGRGVFIGGRETAILGSVRASFTARVNTTCELASECKHLKSLILLYCLHSPRAFL